MGLIKYEEREYNFTWKSIIMFAVFAPLFSLIFFFYVEWHWLEEFTSKLTVWSLNLISGSNHEVFYYNDIVPPIEPWRLRIYDKETGDPLPIITFTKMCTGIHAVLMFFFVTLFTPHSTIEQTTKDIWPRKIKAITITSLLFYFVNVGRMWLQLYLYSIGYEWSDIHYSISAASSFIAVAAILVVHKYVPEFIMTLLWIGDEVKARLNKDNVVSSQKSSNVLEESESNADDKDDALSDNSDGGGEEGAKEEIKEAKEEEIKTKEEEIETKEEVKEKKS